MLKRRNKKGNPNAVLVTCYGKTNEFPSREAAEDFYWQCVEASEGAERDRYVNILIALRKGQKIVHD